MDLSGKLTDAQKKILAESYGFTSYDEMAKLYGRELMVLFRHWRAHPDGGTFAQVDEIAAEWQHCNRRKADHRRYYPV